MKKYLFLLLLATACKARPDDRNIEYERMLAISKGYQAAAESYKHDHTPAGTKHFVDALDSVGLYLDSAKTFWNDDQKAQARHLDSLVKSDIQADKRYNDSVYAARRSKR